MKPANPDENSEKRKEPRSPATGSPIHVCTTVDGSECRYEGVTADVSDSGLSFYTSRTFREGMKLNLSGISIGGNPRAVSVVRCVNISKGIYRVGVSFD